MRLIKKFFRLIVSLGLAAAMCLGVGACTRAPDDNAPYAPPPEWHEDKINKITMFCNDWEQFNNGASVGSPVYEELIKASGCELTARSTSLSNYYTQLDLQRVNRQLDELFIIEGPPSPELYSGLIRDNEIIPVSYYVNESTKDKYPNLYEYLKQFEYMKSNVSYAKGEIWFIPIQWNNDKSLYVRRDWIKNLNRKIDDILVADGVVSDKAQITETMRTQYRFSETGPADLGEFYRLARAFTLYDPDGNGQNDTFGYATEENRDMDSWMHAAYDNPWKMWIEGEDGLYHNSVTSDNSMLAAAFLNKMVKEKYVSQEFGTKDVAAKEEAFETGKAGMMYAHNWYNVICANMMSTSSLSIADARERIMIMNPPAGKTGSYGGQGDTNYYRGWCIREGMSVERLEACLNLMEFLHSEEGVQLVTYGVYGNHWEWKNDDEEAGERVSLCPPDPQGFVQELRWTDPAAFASYLTYTPPEAKALLTNGDILVQADRNSRDSMVISDYPDLYTKTMITYQAGAYDYYDTEVIKIIANNALAADWSFNAVTWKDDWKTKLYTVSDGMKSAWTRFVNTYNSDYFGSKMEREYNEAISSGEVMKVGNPTKA